MMEERKMRKVKGAGCGRSVSAHERKSSGQPGGRDGLGALPPGNAHMQTNTNTVHRAEQIYPGCGTQHEQEGGGSEI